MELNQLIEGGNKNLYTKIKEHFNVKLLENRDWRENSWDSYIEGDTVIISYGDPTFPKASFTHELLHIDTQIKGFKRIFSGISLDKKVQNFLPTLIKYLNNDFQHHKMAKAFLSLGYPPEQFYDVDENPTASFLLEELNKEGHSLMYISLLYMDFIAPLKNITNEQKQSIKIIFNDYEGGGFKQTFSRIDEIINNWMNDPSYDAEDYMIDFLINIGVKDTWISYQKDFPGMFGQNFPNAGFFIGNSFSITDIGKVYGN